VSLRYLTLRGREAFRFILCCPQLRYNSTEGANLSLALLEREGGGEAVGRVMLILHFALCILLLAARAFFSRPLSPYGQLPLKGAPRIKRTFLLIYSAGRVSLFSPEWGAILHFAFCTLHLFLACPAVGAYLVGGKTDCLYDSVD